MILVVDDKGNRIQGVGSTDRSLALLGLGHLVSIAVVSSDQNGVAVLVSSLQNGLQTVVKMLGLTAPECWEASMV